MKQVILITILLVVANTSYSQSNERSIKKIYLQLAGGATNQSGIFSEGGIQADSS
jgi:hypothetical protein